MNIAAPSHESQTLLDNRRASQRLRLGCAAVVWSAPGLDDEGVSTCSGDLGIRVARIDSLSLTGLSFVSIHPYPVEAAVWVRVRLGAKTCQFKGVVRRASVFVHSGRARHLCGVHFVRSQQTAHAVAVISSFMDSASLR